MLVSVDVDLADAEKVNEKFTEEDFDEELGSPTEVKGQLNSSLSFSCCWKYFYVAESPQILEELRCEIETLSTCICH